MAYILEDGVIKYPDKMVKSCGMSQEEFDKMNQLLDRCQTRGEIKREGFFTRVKKLFTKTAPTPKGGTLL